MKFSVKSVGKCAPRLGMLKEIQNLPNVCMETPMAMLYTRGGSIPHITNEVFKMVLKNPQILQIPLVSSYAFQDALEHFNGTITEYVGMKQCISCVAVQDPGDYTQSGHQTQDYIPIWTRHGKILLNADKYMKYIEAAKPDMYYVLSDGDTNIASSNKRTLKAVKNTINYFNQCIEKHQKSATLQKSFVMAAISGGYCLQQRKRCLDAVTVDDTVNGYLIDGLHNNGPEVELLEFKEIKEVIKFIAENLSAEKLKAVHGCWNPVVTLELVKMGIDLFDTSYCHLVTERSAALTFSLDGHSLNQYEINLRKPQFNDDFQPILTSCECMTCTNYSRAYIHHLLTVQELLGPLLLSIHNIHHYLEFFKKIRSSIEDNTLNTVHENITQQYKIHLEIVGKNKPESIAKSEVDLKDSGGLQNAAVETKKLKTEK